MRTGLIAFALTALFLQAYSAENPVVYPGSVIRSIETQQMNYGKPVGFPKAAVYSSSDPFEKVRAFYQGMGKEFVVKPAGKPEEGAHKAYFILDKARNLTVSRKWVAIQSPYLFRDKIKKWFKVVDTVTSNTAIIIYDSTEK